MPAGTYSVRAAFIGYKSTQVDGVKVLAGQTITVDIQLEQTAVQIQEITVVTQTQPLVPRDEVTSKQRIDGEFTSNLPVDRLNSVLPLQPGVVAAAPTATRSRSAAAGPRKHVTYVDGVPVTPGYRGDARVGSAGTEISVGTNALEEASVTTGSSSAEFGNAQSGVISIQTRTGGSKFTGTLGYETDEPFGVNHSLGFNRVTGSLGGPIMRNLTFFVSGALEGQQSVESGMDSQNVPAVRAGGHRHHGGRAQRAGRSRPPTPRWSTSTTTRCTAASAATSRAAPTPDIASNYGVDCQGIRVPSSARSTYQLSGKLNYSFGTGSRLAFTALSSQFQGRTFRENLDSPAGS